jgi:hypothetical protein
MLLHDVSQTALAAAVLTLGLVILLELRSFARLRRSVDINLGRVFEQLEMLRAESRQLLEAQTKAAARLAPVVPPAKLVLAERQMVERPVIEPTALDFVVAPPVDTNAYLNATTLAAHGLAPAEIAVRSGLPAGEARLLASLAAARARREQAGHAEAGRPEAGRTTGDASSAADAARSVAGTTKA